jgi:hypothetical protein
MEFIDACVWVTTLLIVLSYQRTYLYTMLCAPVKVYYAQIYMQYNINCLDSYQIIIIGVIYMHLVSIDICYTGY